MKGMSLGLKEALRLTLEGSIKPLPAENVALVDSVDRVAASDLYALVDSPSMDASLKDGYAVLSHEVADATAENPVRLRLLGSMAAGGEKDIQIKPGTTVRVLTGARIPTGADAVVAEEFVKQGGNRCADRDLCRTRQEYPAAWKRCGIPEMYPPVRPTNIAWYGRSPCRGRAQYGPCLWKSRCGDYRNRRRNRRTG